ncbi:MAG TPA: PD-(D/E)XK nuclease family protein [Terracidiphilus sp.]|nr:PD-(D/E)XK nuclease family protein [Terracidiphilus sp.]
MALPCPPAYNAGMGSLAGAEIDSWLRAGGLVITASDRSARALRFAFHQRRRTEGLSAWASPEILSWTNFMRSAWEKRAADGRMLLNSAQDQLLWADIIGRESHLVTLLDAPRQRLAEMAMRAHELLCLYAPQYLRESARAGWDQDAGTWSRWLSAFDGMCRSNQLISFSRLPIELTGAMQADNAQRPPLLVVGFDRIVPTQKSLFDAWGLWRQAPAGESATQIAFYEAPDQQAEAKVCAQWCNRFLAAHPDARLLVISQEIAARRGEYERAFLRFTPPRSTPLFEFSLGTPLAQTPLVRSALLLLKWLDGSLSENELDWIFSSTFASLTPAESASLQAHMRSLRRRGLQRTHWTLDAFIRPRTGSENPSETWIRRMLLARRRLQSDIRNRDSLEWAAFVPHLLADLGIPDQHPLSSSEFQAYRSFEQALDTCGSLGFDGRRLHWLDFLSMLDRTLNETLFAPESVNAPIQIIGPAEAAGLAADAIWFLGADEDAWPAAGSMHPMLPLFVQREAAMPHASPGHDRQIAKAITGRIMTSAPLVHFSYARQKKEVESRPSRLAMEFAGAPHPFPAAWSLPPSSAPIAACVEDKGNISYSPRQVQGGSEILTAQSQCPFKAFATARLGASNWDRAEAGLTPSQRGSLLHAVLHAIWTGPPNGVRSKADLIARTDLGALVEANVRRVMQDSAPAAVRELMPSRYLDLETERLTRLVTEWLNYEATRCAFAVEEIEIDRTIEIAGLTLHLRLDRIDRLNDGSMLVIDYKSGNVSPASWNVPRPDDVQLPLYAGFGIDRGAQLGGLVFAKLRPGDQTFAGYVRHARSTLLASLNGTNGLVRTPLTEKQLDDWRTCIQDLAQAFLAGRADLKPREQPRTCERCGLQSVCRILEQDGFLPSVEEEEDEEDEEDDDE